MHRYLRNAREVLLWKLDGLSDYDIRRPMTPTGTNLLGLVKHCAAVDFMYFGQVLDRPFPGQDDLDWHEDDDAELSGGMYAAEAESREQVTDFYRRVWAHSDATISELPLDARGTVPWWPETAGTRRCTPCSSHGPGTARTPGMRTSSGSIDGAVGLREGVTGMPPQADAAAWKQHYDKLESIAGSARSAAP